MDIINLAFVEIQHNVNKVKINPLTLGNVNYTERCMCVYGVCAIQSI